MIGYDRRFLSRQAAEASAEVFAGNNIPAILLAEDAPTPLMTYATAARQSAFGLCFTASHNPPEWNGLKVFRGDGSLLLDDETQQIEAETNALTPEDVIKLELDLALEAGIVERRDFTNEYMDAVEKLIDLEAIRNAGLKVIVDPMYGVGQLTLGTVLTEARCRVTFIHERHNPLFGGRSPAPNPEALRLLTSARMRDDGYDLGLAMDGDADRIAIVDERGEYISINDILLLIYWYMHEVRGERGGVVRNLSTSPHAGSPGAPSRRGVLRSASGLQAHRGGDAGAQCAAGRRVLGRPHDSRAHPGEGRNLRVARSQWRCWRNTGRKISELLEHDPCSHREALRPGGKRSRHPRDAHRGAAADQGGRGREHRPIRRYPRVAHGWHQALPGERQLGAAPFLGTEPVLRLTAEADSPEKARELIAWLRQFVAGER